MEKYFPFGEDFEEMGKIKLKKWKQNQHKKYNIISILECIKYLTLIILQCSSHQCFEDL